MYLTIIRPNISFSMNRLSQFMRTPHITHLQSVRKILQYLKRTPRQGIFFSSNSAIQLKTFVDADWGSCPDTRRSVTSFYIFLGNSLVSWKSKKQQVVSRSSGEAEYRVMAHSCYEIVWMLSMLKDFEVEHRKPALLYCDNQAAIHISTNQMCHESVV